MKHHIPILVSEILSFVPDQALRMLDGTFGHAGHALEFIKLLEDRHSSDDRKFYGFDKDAEVLDYGAAYLWSKTTPSEHIELINASYATAKEHLDSESIDFVLLDLGINRAHVTTDERGFSFQAT